MWTRASPLEAEVEFALCVLGQRDRVETPARHLGPKTELGVSGGRGPGGGHKTLSVGGESP